MMDKVINKIRKLQNRYNSTNGQMCSMHINLNLSEDELPALRGLAGFTNTSPTQGEAMNEKKLNEEARQWQNSSPSDYVNIPRSDEQVKVISFRLASKDLARLYSFMDKAASGIVSQALEDIERQSMQEQINNLQGELKTPKRKTSPLASFSLQDITV